MHVCVPVVVTDVLCNRALRPKLIVPPPLPPQKKHSPTSQSSLSEIAVVSPESQFARRRSPGCKSIRLLIYITLQFDGNTFRDVMLVKLGFHMYSHCVSIHVYSLF